MADLFDTLRQRMADSSLTQAELSRRAGVAESVLSRFRRGEAIIGVDVAERIATGLGYRVELRKVKGGNA